MKIAVVTTSIPERHAMLTENMASVRAQTLQPIGHYISIDYAKRGPAANLNTAYYAAAEAGAEWIAQMADDDLMDAHHLETLAAATEGNDIVYSYCRTPGRADLARHCNRPFNADELRAGNYIAAGNLIRTAVIDALEGWSTEPKFEDWEFYLRALQTGAQFHCVPVVTWTYRFHGANLTYPPHLRKPEGVIA